MAETLVVMVPGRLDTATGGYLYDRRMIEELRARAWSVDVRELDPSFPFPTPAARAHAARELAAIPRGTSVLVDGLASGAMPFEIEREARRLRIIALVHHPLADETGLDAEVAAELETSEMRTLASVDLVIVTSRATAARLNDYRVDRHRIVVVEPGTDAAPIAKGSGASGVQLLCVATLTPRKGHDVLFRALTLVGHRNWRLTCVGSQSRHVDTTERLRAQLRASALDRRVELIDELDQRSLSQHYDRADVFVLPARLEGYGMAVAEALARGLPVIGTPTGAVAELVGNEAGLLVPRDDVDALAGALARMIDDPPFRERCRQGARRVRDRLPTWKEAANVLADALQRHLSVDG